MRKTSAVFALLLLASTGSARGQTLFSSGFEAPEYAAGNLAGQDGWQSTDDPPTAGRAIVQTLLSLDGAASLELNADVAFTTAWYYQILDFTPNPATAPILQVTWSSYLSGGDFSNSTLWGIDIYDDSPLFSRRFTAAGVNAADQVVIWDGSNLVDTGFTVTRNEWHHFRLNLDFAASRRNAMLIVDDQAVAIDMPFTPQAGTTVYDVDIIHIDGGGDDTAFFDGLSIAAAADADADGVPDFDDVCTTTPPDHPVDFEGCSTVDVDGDGVGHDHDMCPGTPSCVTSVDAAGCPNLDDDADGTPDGCDNCPGLFNPDQTDTDGDGDGDACDPCPILAFGDVNGDQSFDGRDVQRFAEIVIAAAPSQPELCAADFDEDGDVDVEDSELFAQLLVGL